MKEEEIIASKDTALKKREDELKGQIKVNKEGITNCSSLPFIVLKEIVTEKEECLKSARDMNEKILEQHS